MSVCTNLLLTYCYSTKNLRNYDFVCLFKVIFLVRYKRLNCRISGRIVSISGIRPDIKNGRISGPTLIINNINLSCRNSMNFIACYSWTDIPNERLMKKENLQIELHQSILCSNTIITFSRSIRAQSYIEALISTILSIILNNSIC